MGYAGKSAVCFAVLLACMGEAGAGLKVIPRLSPWNVQRPQRKITAFIVLHTTEGPKRGSLDKVQRNGEAHYFVDQAGQVYKIVDRDRIATHAGRSMWNGSKDIDQYSIGVEVVGYYNQAITSAQNTSLAALVAELQRIYRIADDHVLTHCMVAYGAPNRWHSSPHRGRKRCGMLFARKSVRRRLGLESEPAFDPDVQAGRLTSADAYLARVLYGQGKISESPAAVPPQTEERDGSNVIGPGRSAWDIARDAYDDPATVYVFPDGVRRKGNEIRQWKEIPAGTQVLLYDAGDRNEAETFREIGVDGDTAADIAGSEITSDTTLYFFPDGRVRKGNELTRSELEHLPAGTRLLVGYVHGGAITIGRSAFEVCGGRWNFPATIYRFPDGTFKAGDTVNENKIPKGTMVFFCQ